MVSAIFVIIARRPTSNSLAAEDLPVCNSGWMDETWYTYVKFAADYEYLCRKSLRVVKIVINNYLCKKKKKIQFFELKTVFLGSLGYSKQKRSLAIFSSDAPFSSYKQIKVAKSQLCVSVVLYQINIWL